MKVEGLARRPDHVRPMLRFGSQEDDGEDGQSGDSAGYGHADDDEGSPRRQVVDESEFHSGLLALAELEPRRTQLGR